MNKKKSDKQKIKNYILLYLHAIGENRDFNGLMLIQYIRDRMKNKDLKGDIVLKYLKEMQQDNLIKFYSNGQRYYLVEIFNHSRLT